MTDATIMGWEPQGGTLMWLEAGDAYLVGKLSRIYCKELTSG